MESEFTLEGDEFVVNEQVYTSFWENGYIIVRNLLDEREIEMVKDEMENNEEVQNNQITRDDGEGMRVNYVAWNHPGDDVTGMIARSEKVAGTVEKLMDGEIYHYHSKLIMKNAYDGGAFVWHQDYGYWYMNSCMYPDMVTVWMAIDKADRTNGCLKLIPKSHKMGRIKHVEVGGQAGADPERTKQAQEVLGLVHADLDPGDALILHCNVLHRSDQNVSPNRGWALLSCLNKATNNPVKRHHHASYTPLLKVPNNAIKDCRVTMKGQEFVSSRVYLPTVFK